MAVSTYDDLMAHVGHGVSVVVYGDRHEPHNVGCVRGGLPLHPLQGCA
jgi:hypothetical protein